MNAHVHDSDHLMMCLALRAENEFTAGDSEAPSPISIISYFNKLLSGISCFAMTSSVKLDCFRQSLRRADNSLLVSPVLMTQRFSKELLTQQQ